MTSLLPDALLGAQTPRVHLRPEAARSDGADAAQLSAGYGLVLDPWQRLILDDWLAVGPDGRHAAATCWLSVPRQNGKTAIVEAFELFSLVILGHRMLYTAQELPLCRANFDSLLGWFGRKANDPSAEYPELNAMVKKITHTNGREGIHLTNGGWIKFSARTGKAFRGGSIDALILDEAQFYDDDQHSALGPTLRASPDAQKIYLGTPPTTAAAAEAPFGRMRAAFLSGKGARFTMAEWSPDPKEDPYRLEAWARSNPGLGIRISVSDMHEAVENGEYSRESFQRELLGAWLMAGADELFGPGRWPACRGEVPGETVVEAVAVAVTFGQTHAAVVGTGRVGDRLAILPIRHGPGTEWVLDVVADVTEGKRIPIIVDGGGPARFLVDGLKKVSRRTKVLTMPECKDAIAKLVERVRTKELMHADFPELNAAVAAASWRDVGDMRLLDRQGGDITVLEAGAWALYGLGRRQGSAYEDRPSGSVVDSV